MPEGKAECVDYWFYALEPSVAQELDNAVKLHDTIVIDNCIAKLPDEKSSKDCVVSIRGTNTNVIRILSRASPPSSVTIAELKTTYRVHFLIFFFAIHVIYNITFIIRQMPKSF